MCFVWWSSSTPTGVLIDTDGSRCEVGTKILCIIWINARLKIILNQKIISNISSIYKYLFHCHNNIQHNTVRFGSKMLQKGSRLLPKHNSVLFWHFADRASQYIYRFADRASQYIYRFADRASQYLTNLMHKICFEHMCSKHVEAWNKTYCKTNFVHEVR